MTTIRASKDPQIFDQLKNLTDVPSSFISSKLTPTEWNDTTFAVHQKLAMKHYTKIEDSASVAKVALKFIAVYLGADKIEQEQHISLYFTLLANIKMGNDYIFPEGSNAGATVETGIREVNDFSFPEGGTNWQVANVTMNRADVSAFYKDILGLCTSKDAKDLQKGINIAAFIALNMLRSFRKDITSLASHIPINGFSSYQNLFGHEFPRRFPPPSLTYMSLFPSYVPPAGLQARNLMAYCVHAWIDCQDQSSDRGKMGRGLLKAGCLLSLSENGLGALAWTTKAVQFLNIKLGEYLAALMLDNSMEDQVLKIGKFLINQNKGVTWPFCRLFEESALCGLSNSGCPEVSVISAIIAMDSSEKVKEMPQFRNLAGTISSMVPIAMAVKEVLKPELPTSAASEIGARVLERLNKFKGKTVYAPTSKVTMARTSRLISHSKPTVDEDEDEEDLEASDESDTDIERD